MAQLRGAIRRLAGCLKVERLSGVYETEPAYVADQPPYLNMALQGRTVLDPHPLLMCLKQIERSMGRVGGLRWGERPIDLDILLYGERQVSTPDLQIPHARLHERAFVLVPLAELAPDLPVPGLERTVGELLAQAPRFGAILGRLGRLEGVDEGDSS